MALQFTVWLIFNVHCLHTAATVASGLKQKCPGQPDHFLLFFPRVGHYTVGHSQAHVSGKGQSAALIAFVPSATTTLIYLGTILVSLLKFLFLQGGGNCPTVLTFVSMESRDALLAGGRSQSLCPGQLMSCRDQMAMWQVMKTGAPIPAEAKGTLRG